MTVQDVWPHSAARATTGEGLLRGWLLLTAALILAMVMVGGATRLTESGLSITQWKPVTGVIPPLSLGDWQAAFDGYKQIPQYAQMNPDMTLAGFKTIYWWEWSHRLLARVLGLIYIVPALYFWSAGRLKGRLGARVGLATALLALEPIVGWWMVSSGLSVRTEVAQQRLALHLLIAAATFGTLIYAAVGLSRRAPRPGARGFSLAAHLFVALVFVQLGLGALVAGLRAGFVYNTWPLMDGRWIPKGLFATTPAIRAIWSDVTTSQFDHRVFAYLVVLFALVQAGVAARLGGGLAARAAVLAGAALIQAALGIVTLLFVVPLDAALTHQAFALILFGLAVAHASATRDEAAQTFSSRAPLNR
ncbi:MAG TPA: COX15/CtaA family protein [Roseiarcus sp.]|nr:COX15/CtaA family protein [Roseiarcus sp.]